MSAVPRQEYKHDFLDAVRDVMDLICLQNSIERARIIAYLFKHTICYQEFTELKQISANEFANGRRLTGGGRMDGGCGMTKLPNIRSTLSALQKDQILLVEEDTSDKARIKKRYGLNLPSIYKGYPIDTPGSALEDGGGIQQIPQRYPTDTPPVSSRYPRGIPEIPRSVVNSSVNSFKKITLEKAADAASLNEEEKKKEEEETEVPPPVEQKETEQQPPYQEAAPAPPVCIDKQAVYFAQIIKQKAREILESGGRGGTYWHISPGEGESLIDGVLTFRFSNYPSVPERMERDFGDFLRQIARKETRQVTDIRFIYRPRQEGE